MYSIGEHEDRITIGVVEVEGVDLIIAAVGVGFGGVGE
jgi:hypothetical protein